MFLKTAETYRVDSQTLPRDYFTSAAIYAQEIARIFHRHWVAVGRAEQIARPGEYFLASLVGESLIVVRGGDGQARAFHNVCRHRGTRICEQASGRFQETIQCPYHAWTYALDGRLLGAPHMKEAGGFAREDYPLHAVATVEWEGIIFVNLAHDPQPFAQAFAPLVGRFTRYGLPALTVHRRIEYDVATNWKLLFINYSECLHCPLIHPLLSERTAFTSGANDLIEGPFLGGYMLLTNPEGTMSISGRRCATPIATLPPDDLQRAYYYTIFPNLCLSLFPEYAMIHRLLPDGPTRTRVICEWLFDPDAAARDPFNPDDAVEFWDLTNREDWRITERSQAGISSMAYTPGPYSPRESLLAAWDREYLRQLGPPGTP